MRVASYGTELTDAHWGQLEPLVAKSKPTGEPRTWLRLVLNALLYVG